MSSFQRAMLKIKADSVDYYQKEYERFESKLNEIKKLAGEIMLDSSEQVSEKTFKLLKLIMGEEDEIPHILSSQTGTNKTGANESGN